MPFFCPILPNTPIDPGGIDNPAGSGPYYVAERIVNQRVVLKRNPYYRGDRPANVDQIVWTVGESREACLLAVEQDRIDYCLVLGPDRVSGVLPRSTASTGRAGSSSSGPGSRPGSSPSTTTGRRSRGRARSRSRRRSTTRSTARRWRARGATSPASAPIRCCLPRSARPASIYPLEGADPATAQKWLARATFRPTTLVFYTTQRAASVARRRRSCST